MGNDMHCRPAAIELIEKRYEYVQLLQECPRQPRDIVEATGASRATVHRVLNELLDAGLVERVRGMYAVTAMTPVLVGRYEEYLDVMNDVIGAECALQPLPTDHGIPPEMLHGADIFQSTGGLFSHLYVRVEPILTESDVVRAMLPTVGTPRLLRQLHPAADAGTDLKILLSSDLLQVLSDQFPEMYDDVRYCESCALHVGETPPYIVIVGDTRSAVIVQTDEAAAHAAILNDRGEAVEWASDLFQEFVADSIPARTGDEVVPTGASDHHVEELAAVFSQDERTGTAADSPPPSAEK